MLPLCAPARFSSASAHPLLPGIQLVPASGTCAIAADSTVSGADSVVVIDARTNGIVKRFDGVGKYPWSVTIPNGQNYCH